MSLTFPREYPSSCNADDCHIEMCLYLERPVYILEHLLNNYTHNDTKKANEQPNHQIKRNNRAIMQKKSGASIEFDCKVYIFSDDFV